MSETRAHLGTLLDPAVIAAGEAMFRSASHRPRTPADDGPSIVTVLPFNGDIVQGALGVMCDREVAAATYPIQGRVLDDAEIEDWAGECANQLLGRVKAGLATSGFDFQSGTPVVLRGLALAQAPRSQPNVRWYRIPTDAGDVTVWVDVRTPQDLDIAAPDEGEAGLQCGEALFF
jgi:chemotaxis phosphatase CheX-like protein